MSLKKNCIKCGEEFLIIDQELAFYKDRDFPLPIECPTCRQKRRMSQRNERKLYSYNCDNCNKDIVVAFDPSGTEQQVFCKECYQKYMQENDCILGYSEGAKALEHNN